MYKFVGKDANDIPRVYGYANTETMAIYECQEAVKEYVERRPDTGPTEGWKIDRA